MSVVSNRHNVVPFIAGKSVAFNGQRLSRVLYKPSKKGNKEASFPSVCVSVPKIKEPIDSEVIERLHPFIIELIEGTQDKIVKSLYENSNGTISSIHDDDISIDAVIGYLEAESSGGRLTKEALNKWFVDNMQDNLYIVLCEKMGYENPDKNEGEAVQRQINGYKEMISALSGGATVYQEKQVKALLKAISVATSDDDIAKKLTIRLEKMLIPNKIMENLLEL